MFRNIIKRDGRVVNFDASKITDAITKAGSATGEFSKDVAKKFTLKVLNLAYQLYSNKTPTVEEIQDIVEEVLISSPFTKTAKAYIIYREQHNRLREISDQADVTLIDDYLNKLDWEVKENSNMSFSLQGLNNYISSHISKTYWLNKIYPKEIRDAHIRGDLHIHDLGLLSVYCVGWDLQDLLIKGFRGAKGKVSSKPSKHFRSVLGQVVNFFYTLQGEAAGAQAFSNFDTLLAPFIAYDNLSYDEVKQSLQEFIFNVNVPTRVGFQSPFTNITLDLKVPSYMENQAVIVGGKMQNAVYGDFQKEMYIFNKALLEVLSEGDADGRVFTFPIPTYNITKDFEWDSSALEPLWKATAKYGIPYFTNYINSDMSPEDARSMCCRLRIDNRELRKRGGGLFGANPLTGSVGVVTINMPRIGYIAKTEDEFIERVFNIMDVAKNSLEIKRKVLEKFTQNNLYPYSKFYLSAIKERFGEYWKNHFSTIGLVGMNEACINLLGQDLSHKSSQEFAKKVLEVMREKLIDFQSETGNNYNLEATPAEGTSYRLALLDKKKYPNIKTATQGNRPYYTNSTQLPVGFSDDIFEALDLQDDLQSSYTGGTVLHIFVGEKIENPNSVKKLIKTIFENYKLPYVTITPTFSICPIHGYIAGEHYECPLCKQEKIEKIEEEIRKLKEAM